MDAETIICRTPLAQYQIKWDEVSHIEADTQGNNLVFCGEDKILVAFGPLFWSGKDKTEMLTLVNEQVEKHRIKIPQTEKLVFRVSKNTKVS